MEKSKLEDLIRRQPLEIGREVTARDYRDFLALLGVPLVREPLRHFIARTWPARSPRGPRLRARGWVRRQERAA